MCSGKVLILLTSAQKLILNNGTMISTGFHMREFAEPVIALKARDYQIYIATPDGSTPIPDPAIMALLTPDERKTYNALLETLIPALLPLSFEAVTEELLGTIDGLFIPGGYGPLADLYAHPHLKKLLKHMHRHQKPTAAICHGVLGLCYSRPPQEATESAATPWLYEGYQMTCYPRALDQAQESEVLGAPLPFYMADVLKAFGAELVFSDNDGDGLVVLDRELITGENASATQELTQVFLSQLDKFMKRRLLD